MWRALALRMGWPIGLLKRAMSHREFVEWCWAWNAEPFDDERCHDLPAALQIAHLVNMHLKQGAQPFTHLDFMPYRRTPEPPEEDIDNAVIGRL